MEHQKMHQIDANGVRCAITKQRTRLYQWLDNNYDEIAKVLSPPVRRGTLVVLTEYAKEAGIRTKQGAPVSKVTLRNTWERVARDRRGKIAKPAQVTPTQPAHRSDPKSSLWERAGKLTSYHGKSKDTECPK
jgi:hypothetical protein